MYILWPFDIFHTYLVYFSRFGMLYQEKSGNPALPKMASPTFFSEGGRHQSFAGKKYIGQSISEILTAD
jgi:hypothetical protein